MNFLFLGIFSRFFLINFTILNIKNDLNKCKKGGYFRAGLTCRFRASLKHKDDGQTKFIKPNSQIQDIIIGSIHREQG